jgi:hypothetical protein
MRPVKIYLLVAAACLLFSCSGNKKTNSARTNKGPAGIVDITPDSIRRFDLKQDLSGNSLQDLRLLKNLLYAKQGYCFMEADLRGYFAAHMQGYDSLMDARFWAEDDPENKVPFPPIKFSPEEAAFIKKIEALEGALKQKNFEDRNGVRLANASNIINLFQFKGLSGEFMTMLDKNNFVIVPTNKIQLFHIYEENDYRQVPSFVTTDMYLQLYHMYFSYVLRSLEESKFMQIATDLSDGMSEQAMKTVAATSDANVKANAEYAAVFYAIPYYILTGKKKNIPGQYKEQFEKELANIDAAKDEPSEFLGYKEQVFGYSLFKPRGHYTRSTPLQKYFKAMMWLQTASFCRSTPEQLKRATFMASLLNGGKSGGQPSLMNLYNAIYEPIVFLVGEPDNLSVNDIVAYLGANNIGTLSAALEPATQTKIDAYLKDVAKGRNKIKPKVPLSCADKINFMPQRYLFDNEILQELVDVTPNASRAYPMGLDVFAALGNKTAENILLNELKEQSNWKAYTPKLDALKKKFEHYDAWDKTVYNKWISTLNTMQTNDARHPGFMQTDAWGRKELNTALASWAELKHDAILYGEQPEAAECGGAGPPDPITVGYVEPNVNFWKGMGDLLKLTEELLKRNGLVTEDIGAKTKQLSESAQFLLSASEKELRHQKLTEQEYKTIEAIGASTEYLTLSIIEPEKNLQNWENVKGPDKSVAVVADVYTRNVADCDKNGILHEGVGGVNELYIVVEIEGNLYLTRGATFSYYEFVQPLDTRRTDEEWQKMLESKKDLPAIPQWMKDIILPSKDVPSADEKVFYSSGC